MRLLLDTHALLWWVHEPTCLSTAAFDAISAQSNDVLVSAVSAMEIATKARNGKLEYHTPLATNFLGEAATERFTPLSIASEHAQRAGNLPGRHRDPWDRLLVAQAQIERLRLVSADAKLADWPVELLW